MAPRELFPFLVARSAEMIERESLRRKITGRKNLRVKLGIDPTTPDLHLGHVVPLRMLRSFQDAGHHAVLIIGDFTGQIGDPSGKSRIRRQLTQSEVKANERTYRAQVARVLDLRRTEIRHNNEWHGRMKAREFLELLTHFSMKTMWAREDFQRRLRAGQGVRLHEAMYAVLQAYDSVAVRADVELGSLDQRLNLLAGRELQRAVGQQPQDIVLLPYLIGLDGRQKMSKTAGNTINLRDSAGEMFGKAMSIPDSLIINYAELAAWLSLTEVQAIRRRLQRHENPRDIKLDVAAAIVRLYHGSPAARRAGDDFLKLFSRREAPAAIPSVGLRPGSYSGLRLLERLGAARSRSAGRRLIAGRAVEVNGATVRDPHQAIIIRRGTIIRVGKHRLWRVR